LALAHDRPGDPPRAVLLAELVEDVGDLRLVCSAQELGGRLAARGVEPHVEWLVAAEAEAAPARVELPRGDAEIHHDAVDRPEGLALDDGDDVAEARVHDRRSPAEWLQPRPCNLDG